MANGEITLTVAEDGSTRAETGDGRRASARVELDRWQSNLVALFEDWLRSKKISRRLELEVFGELLYRALFPGEVGALFRSVLAATPAGQRLRLQLSFEGEAPRLAGVPWEYLYSPAGSTGPGFFLATDVRLALTRHPPLLGERLPTLRPEAPPLRLLVVASKPEDLGKVIDEEALPAILDLARRQPTRAEPLEEPTMERLLDRLGEVRPHVLHFIGHARLNSLRRQGEIALLKPDGRSAAWYPEQTFAESLTQTDARPQLVLLHACEGATVDPTRAFAGLATRLVRAGTQAVVAMQYPVSNAVAVAFSDAFYDNLSRGRPVDEAVQAGRARLALSLPDGYGNRAFGAPVLSLRSRDGFLHPPPTERPA